MLELKNINKTFNKGTPNAKQALHDLSIHFRPGDFVSIIGSNGAGKSTVFNAIGGSFLVDSGHIVLDGQDITFMPEYKRAVHIGRLFQDPLRGTAPNMTIEENMAMVYLRSNKARSIFGISSKERDFFRSKLQELGLGLEDRLKSKVGLLSGGQRQALTLLMATMTTPKVLLLDEHTAALDPATADKVLELTQNIVKAGNITTLMITHNISSALALGNRTVMMNNGSVILDISGDERDRMTVPELLELFKEKSHTTLDDDRILLTND
ncbi:MAG: ATP-binding cassette domain-containing protein [Firmicutes bacterium]|nr:ATP-binding cassette domain-containing protein [Bacillota bacterium]MBQ3199978.1 ATP-binding cassette domain-containing protein [Bacillota bacterium]